MAEAVFFRGSRGHELAGIFHRPSTDVKAGIVLAHCFTCSKDLSASSRIAKALTREGYAVLRFDFTGLGESEGSFESSTFVANVGDLTQAALWLIDQGFGPCGMIGHSLGGAATLIAASRIRPVRAVATIGAPSTAKHVLHLISPETRTQAEAEGCAYGTIGGREFPISYQFLADLEHYDEDAALKTMGRPLLVMHSPSDETVPVSEGERIFAVAEQPKAFVPLLDANHLLTGPSDAAQASKLLVDWFDRTL